jgi:hypothetical protein
MIVHETGGGRRKEERPKGEEILMNMDTATLGLIIFCWRFIGHGHCLGAFWVLLLLRTLPFFYLIVSFV